MRLVSSIKVIGSPCGTTAADSATDALEALDAGAELGADVSVTGSLDEPVTEVDGSTFAVVDELEVLSSLPQPTSATAPIAKPTSR